MKKLVSISAFAAIVALAFSCSIEEQIEQTQEITVSENQVLISGNVTTNYSKAEFGTAEDGFVPVYWSTGDAINIVQLASSTSKYDVDLEVTESSAEASFTLAVDAVEGEVSYLGIYPKDVASSYSSNEVTFAISATQTPVAGSVDPNAMVMVAKSDYDEQPSNVNLTFNHAVAYGKMILKNLAYDSISSVTITQNDADAIVSSACTYDLSSGTTSANSGTYALTLDTSNLTVENGSLEVWFACLPFSTAYFTVNYVSSTGVSVTKVIYGSISFQQGCASLFSVDMTPVLTSEYVTSWGSTFFSTLQSYIGDNFANSFTYNKFTYIKGEGASCIFGGTYIRSGGVGNSEKNAFQFVVDGPGTLSVEVTNHGAYTAEKALVVALNGEAMETTYDAPNFQNGSSTYTIDLTSIEAQTTISLYEVSGEVNFFDITWTPDGAEGEEEVVTPSYLTLSMYEYTKEGSSDGAIHFNVYSNTTWTVTGSNGTIPGQGGSGDGSSSCNFIGNSSSEIVYYYVYVSTTDGSDITRTITITHIPDNYNAGGDDSDDGDDDDDDGDDDGEGGETGDTGSDTSNSYLTLSMNEYTAPNANAGEVLFNISCNTTWKLTYSDGIIPNTNNVSGTGDYTNASCNYIPNTGTTTAYYYIYVSTTDGSNITQTLTITQYTSTYYSGETSGEEEEEEVDYDTNLWEATEGLATTFKYYTTGWSSLDTYVFTESNGTYTYYLPTATSAQWQAQLFLSKDIAISSSKSYDVSFKFKSDKSFTGLTYKITNATDSNEMYYVSQLAVTADAEVTYSHTSLTGASATSLQLIFDFGGNLDETTITISDIVVKVHKDDSDE